jgi:hypothetical protein
MEESQISIVHAPNGNIYKTEIIDDYKFETVYYMGSTTHRVLDNNDNLLEYKWLDYYGNPITQYGRDIDDLSFQKKRCLNTVKNKFLNINNKKRKYELFTTTNLLDPIITIILSYVNSSL